MEHQFPPSVTPPLVDSDTIAVAAATGPNAPLPGKYSYNLLVSTIASVGGTPTAISDISEVIIQLIETPGTDPVENLCTKLSYLTVSS